ncbi:hypothetical protein [Anaerococcus porci]|uniref:hypothetical protein n=1 Tax=Anaerococcus porci TaxID=2652269 RepID=UPI002A7587DC|nr:hypothetical protein [Anaerococcus porci]MDY3005500.1 hypothetical protein [Anaerococcus porci]
MKRKKNLSSSRHKNKRTRKKDIRISSTKKRDKIRRKKKKKTYMRRRLVLLLILFLIIFLIFRFVYGFFNQYKNFDYPEFRNQFLESITQNVFVANTDGRSLTSSEKEKDFKKLYETIVRNHVIDNDSEEAFKEFSDSYDSNFNKVKESKTDQEFYDIIDSYLSILSDNRTKILDKKSYDMLFDYYKEDKNSPRAKILGNSQVVNRYKRLIGKKSNLPKININENGSILEITIPAFNSMNLEEDMNKIKDILKKNTNIKNVYLDFSDNESTDDKYAFRLLSLLIHDDYQKEKLVFYRGNLLKENLSFMKENKDNLNISSSFMENPSSKYPEKLDYINKDYYMYYDTINIDIKKDRDLENKNIFILVNENTKNSPITLTHLLKETSKAYVVKNALDSETSKNDRINYLRSDFFNLDYSGLVISIDDSYELDENDKYLKYDQKINTDNPKTYVLENIK